MADDPALDRIYALIGKIATSWSEMENLWYLIFAELMPGATREKLDAIFFQWDTSAKQRDLVMAVADAAYPRTRDGKRHPIRRRVGELYAKANDAAGRRNAAVHAVIREEASLAAFLMGTKNYTAGHGLNSRKPNRLAGKRLEQELRDTVKMIDSLRSELGAFVGTISRSPPVPLGPFSMFHKQEFPPQNWIFANPATPADPKASD